MINKKINKWTVLSKEDSRGGQSYYKCQCECGSISVKRKAEIYKALGCLKCYVNKLADVESMIGKRFGSWSVIKLSDQSKRNKYYECKCECGNISRVFGAMLRAGKSKVCTRCRASTHKLSRSKIYYVWQSMLQRCNNAKDKGYHNYGGRGIRVCSEWHDFNNFFKDMGDQPLKKEIDRINNDGNYEPANCRWATRKENSNNKRK